MNVFDWVDILSLPKNSAGSLAEHLIKLFFFPERFVFINILFNEIFIYPPRTNRFFSYTETPDEVSVVSILFLRISWLWLSVYIGCQLCHTITLNTKELNSLACIANIWRVLWFSYVPNYQVNVVLITFRRWYGDCQQIRQTTRWGSN